MVDPWKTLGIGPTADLRRIKKAYAARLKHAHPEDDPEGFQELRRAYEIALESARWLQGHGERARDPSARATPPDSAFPDPRASRRRNLPSLSPPPMSRWASPTLGLRAQEALWAEEAADELMKGVEQLHDDEDAWTSEAAWRALLENEALWNVDTRDAFERRLLVLLALNGSGLSARVWSILEREYQWAEQRLSLYRSLPADQVDRVTDYIDYLAAVEQAERLCDDGLYREAIERVEPIARTVRWELGTRARLVLARCYLMIRSLGKAEQILADVIQADPTCIPAYLLRAAVFRAGGMLPPARDMYLEVLRRDPNHKGAAVELVTVQGEILGPGTQARAPARSQADADSGAGPSPRILWILVVVAAGHLILNSRPDADDLRLLLITVPWMILFAAAAFSWVWWRRGRYHVIGLGLESGADGPDSKRAPSAEPNSERANLRRMPDRGYPFLDSGRLLKALIVVLVVMVVIALIW